MSFSPIVNKPGVYRHSGTGFIVHEVRSIAELLKANGMLYEQSNGQWEWMAGADLKSAIAVSGATTLQELLLYVCWDVTNVGYGWTHLGPGVDGIRAGSFYKKRLAANTRHDPTGAKIFALITDFRSGRGVSDNLGSTSYPNLFSGDVFKTKTSDVITPFASGYNTVATQAYSNGVGVIGVPIQKSWSQLLDEIFHTYPNIDRSEVASRAATAKTLVLQWIAKYAPPRPELLVPGALKVEGGFHVIAPRRDVIISSAATRCRMTRVYGCGFRVSDGSFFTSYDMAQPASVQNDSPSWWGIDGGTGTPTAQTLGPIPLDRADFIDGVRIERFMGGAAGVLLSATGERDPSSTIHRTSASYMADYMNAMNPYVGADVPRLVVNGAPEADPAYATRVEGLYPTMVAIPIWMHQLTNWDTLGFGLGQLLYLAQAAMDPGKHSRWHMAQYQPGLVSPGVTLGTDAAHFLNQPLFG